MKKKSLTLGLIELFVAIMAIPSGFIMVFDPVGTLIGLPLDLLDGSPFKDYLIPGLFLFIVNGIGHLVAGIFSLNKRAYSGLMGVLFGLILVTWILAQLYYTKGIVHFLQPLFFIIGAVEMILGFLIARERKTVI